MTAIIVALIPLAIKLITQLLDARQADIETKKAWLSFIDLLGKKQLISRSLHDSYARQGDALAAEIARMNAGK